MMKLATTDQRRAVMTIETKLGNPNRKLPNKRLKKVLERKDFQED